MNRKEMAMEILHKVDVVTYLHTKFQKCFKFSQDPDIKRTDSQSDRQIDRWPDRWPTCP